MHRRRLLRSLAFAGLGALASTCAVRRDGEPPAADDQRPGGAPDRGESPAPDATDHDAADPDAADPDGADPEPAQPEDVDEADDPGDATAEGAGRVEVLCREALGLRPAAATDARHRLDRLTLHHTAVPLEAAALAPERLRRHQEHHQGNGWADIAYHYAVDLAGNVYELRDPHVPGDTFTDYDTTGHLHVVCEGNFESQQPTDALLDGVGALLAALAREHDLSLASLQTHRTYVPTTACPGQHLRARLGEVQAHAARHLRDGAPALALACGTAARQRVAAIEAG